MAQNAGEGGGGSWVGEEILILNVKFGVTTVTHIDNIEFKRQGRK